MDSKRTWSLIAASVLIICMAGVAVVLIRAIADQRNSHDSITVQYPQGSGDQLVGHIQDPEVSTTPEKTGYENSYRTPKIVSQTSKPDESSRVSGKYILGGVSDDYFDDALFIGDSRTVGLFQCGSIPDATYFCEIGIGNEALLSKSLSIPGLGSYTLSELLSRYYFGKIYIAAGINQLYASPQSCFEDFKKIVELIRSYEPNAQIYIQSNIKATAAYASGTWFVSRERLDEYNQLLSTLDNQDTIIYLDVASQFDGSDGYLNPAKSFDGLHLTNQGYIEWAFYLKTHAWVPEGTEIERDPAEVNLSYNTQYYEPFNILPAEMQVPEEYSQAPESSSTGESSLPAGDSGNSEEGSSGSGESSGGESSGGETQQSDSQTESLPIDSSEPSVPDDNTGDSENQSQGSETPSEDSETGGSEGGDSESGGQEGGEGGETPVDTPSETPAETPVEEAPPAETETPAPDDAGTGEAAAETPSE
ncbi:MAG: hypothetical protein J6P72_10400 [Firmicutes bacterium]|nr:hypothetical protein [Bacillota bacterium]